MLLGSALLNCSYRRDCNAQGGLLAEPGRALTSLYVTTQKEVSADHRISPFASAWASSFLVVLVGFHGSGRLKLWKKFPSCRIKNVCFLSQVGYEGLTGVQNTQSLLWSPLCSLKSWHFNVIPFQCRVILNTTVCQWKLTTSTKKGISFLRNKSDTYSLHWIQPLFLGLKQDMLQQFLCVFFFFLASILNITS